MPHFTIPKHVITGANALEEARPYLSGYGKKAFIVTGKHVGKSPMMESLKKVLDECEIEYVVFDGITGEPTDTMIVEGVRAFREAHADFVIGIGGGSPLDAAKAIAVMAVNEGNLSDYMGKELQGAIPPIVAIPTTAGTGSEATKFTIVTDAAKDIKMLLKGECLVPDMAILNPAFAVDMPKSVTAATGLDALTHAIEAYTSVKACALTDVYAISAVKRIMKYLPVAYMNGTNKKAREEMMLAAYEAGVCINNSSVTLVHGMSRPIGALFHVPHGLSNAMLLEKCLSFALDGATARFADLGREAQLVDRNADDETAARVFLKCVGKVCRICEVPSMKEYGIGQAKFEAVIDKMAEDAIASGSPANTVKKVTKKDCIRLYREAYGL